MPDRNATHNELRRCLAAAGSSASKKLDCQRKFEAAGGKVEGGKVFFTPDGEATFVTNGGKVFISEP